MKKTILIVSAFLLFSHALVAQSQKKSTKAAPASSKSLLNPASLNDKAPEVFKAKFTTTQGEFVVEVTRSFAPLGADRFYNLVKYHFYDQAAFFRVIPGFMVQFGISPRPDVSRVWESANIKDDPVTQSNTRGMITFATAGPNTRTTQVFISFGDNSNLNGMGFAPFGKVISGMEVVDKLYGGYGEGAPDGNGPNQGRMQKEGKAYLDKYFPQLDSIKTAVIVTSGAAATPATTPKTTPAKTTPAKTSATTH
jgi:peptidyl-prolyl cis-trans isomerase A (cyclophilin A)